MLDLLYALPIQFYVVSQVITFVTSFFLAIMVYFKAPKGKVSNIGAFFPLAVAQWSLFYVIWLSADNPALAEFYLRTCMLGIAVLPAVFTHFIIRLLNLNVPKNLIKVNYGISLCVIATIYTPLYAHDFGRFLVFPYWGKAGILFPLHLVHFLMNVIYSQLIMAVAMRRVHGLLRIQIGYILMGTTIGYFSGIINYFCWYRINIPPVLNAFVSVYVILIAYAIIRYRLMDIRVIAVRALIFFSVYMPILLIPFFVGYWGEGLFEKIMGKFWWMFPCVLTGIFAIAGWYGYQYLKIKAEKALMKKKLRYLQSLGDFLEDIKSIRTLDQLIRTVLTKVIEIIKVDYASLYLLSRDGNNYRLGSSHLAASCDASHKVREKIDKDSALIAVLAKNKGPIVREELKFEFDLPKDETAARAEKELEEIGASVVIPSFYHETLIAAIVLGEQRTYEIYTKDDIEAFNALGG